MSKDYTTIQRQLKQSIDDCVNSGVDDVYVDLLNRVYQWSKLNEVEKREDRIYLYREVLEREQVYYDNTKDELTFDCVVIGLLKCIYLTQM